MNIDEFGEIIDGFLKDNHIQMLVDMPEGTIEPEVKDNARLGGAIQFYIMLHALKVTLSHMLNDMGDMLDPAKRGDMIDAILGLVKNELMKE